MKGCFGLMRKKLFFLFWAMLCFLSACGNKNATYDEFGYSIKSPDFSGYICGYEGSETFIQLPIFIPIENDLLVNDITKIVLSGDEVALSCSDYKLSSFTESKYDGYKFSTLSFRVLLAEKGNFSVNKLSISLSGKSTTELNLGKIDFDIRENQAPKMEYLSMSQFFINQEEPSTLRISYVNNTNEPISIKSFSYPTDICSGIEIEKYSDFELSSKEESLIIPPKEEKTFVVTFDFESEFIDNYGHFFYFLPFVEYEIDNTQVIIPGQTQATVVQAPFSEEAIKRFIN